MDARIGLWDGLLEAMAGNNAGDQRKVAP